jgi:hypothetical protein
MSLNLEDYYYFFKGNVAEQKVCNKKVYNSMHSVQTPNYSLPRFMALTPRNKASRTRKTAVWARK